MILIGLALWLAILAVYSAVWSGLVVALWRVQTRRRLSWLAWDGSITVLVLRVIIVAMPLFPMLAVVIYTPLYYVSAAERELVKPRLIDDPSISSYVAAAIAMSVSLAFCAFWIVTQRRMQRSVAA